MRRRLQALVTRGAVPLLLLLGGASGAVYYLRLTRRMALADYIQQPLLDMPKILGATPDEVWGYLLTVLGLFGLYYLGYRIVLLRTSRAIVVVVVLLALVFGLLLLPLYPVTATDIFNYIFFGRVWAFQGQNPYVLSPSLRPADPIYPYTAYDDEPTVYGALFTHLSALLAWLAGPSLSTAVLVFKGAMLACHALALALVYWVLRRTRPALAAAGLYLLAWNPLVLFNTAGDGHNDIVMLVLILLALAFASRNRWVLACAAIVLSASVKYVSLLLVPVFVVATLRRLGWRRWPVVARGLALGVGLAVLLHAPFYAGPDTVLGALPQQGGRFTVSFALLVRNALDGAGLPVDSSLTARGVAYGLFALLYLRELVRLRPGFDGLVYACYQALFVFLLLGNTWFQPWYVTWLVGPAALLVGTPVATRTIAFTLGAMLVHLVTGFGWRMNWLDSSEPLLQLAAVALVFTPPLLVALFEAWRAWRLRRLVLPAPN